MDWIGWIGLDQIVSYRLDEYTLDLCTGWLLIGWDGWDGWTGWGIGGMGVGQTDVSTCQNGSATVGAGAGSPPLDIEGW